MEAQQLAAKVSQLESRVSTLEDEGKIIKGEVKQILTEIRSAILVRDKPFETESRIAPPAASTHVVSTAASEPAKVELVMPRAPEPEPEPDAEPVPPPPLPPAYVSEPVMLRPSAAEPHKPDWSLLTIAGLSAWAEDAMRRLGSLRLEILLDLCEAAGHLTPDARAALSRITDLDIAEPDQAPSSNDTVVILRQLEALVNDEEDAYGPLRHRRGA